MAPASRVEGLESRVLFATFTVTSMADDGPGSLRQAIVDANSAAGADTIAFAIPGGGVHTISPLSPLPVANMPVTIDATTQPGYAGSPLIELDGINAGPTADGLTLRGGFIEQVPPQHSLFRGLAVNRFRGNGIVLGSPYADLEGCRIGVTPAGDAARPNGGAGVIVTASNIVIGGTTAAQRNVISGNVNMGVYIFRLPSSQGFDPTFISIQGNFIGTDVTGTVPIGNGGEGVFASSPSVREVDVGGTTPGAGNLISGNAASGVRFDGIGNGTVRGNLIGTDVTGTRPMGNGTLPAALYRDGVTIVRPSGNYQVGGNTTAARNVISANAGSGVYLSGGTGNATDVWGNFVGTDAAGQSDLGNGSNGVTIVQAMSSVAANLISGNGGDGLHVEKAGTASEAFGNYIGTNAAGTAALGNDGDGVDLLDSGPLTLGGPTSGQAPPPVIDPSVLGPNLISGNRGHGVRLSATSPKSATGQVIYNYIGTDSAGAKALGNAGSGVYVASGYFKVGALGRGNLISGNGGDGVTVARPAFGTSFEQTSTVQGNRIGTTADGGSLGNAGHGVAVLGADFVTIGDTFTSSGNTIAHNGGAGVWVSGATADKVKISGNLIYSNALLEIDLGGDGVTPNDAGDADAGPNRLLNFPVLMEVGAVPANTTLPVQSIARFSLSAEPSRTYWVEFFAAAAPDPSGHGGGSRRVGATSVTTDAAGNFTGVVSLGPVAAGEFVSATTTDTNAGAGGFTSEFSAAVAATPAEVYGRYLFYNHSAYDGFGAGADPRDDGAIVAGRFPLLGPGTPSFVNFTNYSRGLNGVMIDVARLPAGSVLGADDFEFRRGPGDSAATWADAPAPSSITVRRGAGVGGSDRVTLVWPDAGTGPGAAAANAWLQVTLKATPDTGLSRPDVFYFGNLVGETSTVGPFRVDAADVTDVRSLLYKPQLYGTDPWDDFDKDRRLDARDLAIARANFGRILGSLTAEPAPPAPTSVVYGGTPLTGVRSSLARRRAFVLD